LVSHLPCPSKECSVEVTKNLTPAFLNLDGNLSTPTGAKNGIPSIPGKVIFNFN